ncbi:MAG: glycosyl hydrolase family 18 [Candidatus Methylomirabilota bacterium]|nr:MAG: glycosyl hydrolase family 18 [candidate division NC10 bacterium]
MRNKIIFGLAFLGLLTGLVSAYIYGTHKKPLPPTFNPAPNPYAKGIYATGIIESYQTSGQNTNIYPEVAGTITKILVAEGAHVRQGEPLLLIDDSIQRATVEQQKSQAEAALTLLQELKAQPRKENLEIAKAQVEQADASLKNVQDQLDKQRELYELYPSGISRDTLDNAINAVKVAKANLDVAHRQYDLTQAGAWTYDIANQERLYEAASKAFKASSALLAKYTIKAPVDGVIFSVKGAVGSYISPLGTYDTYTQGMSPVLVMGSSQAYLGVRCYIDEILIHRLPPASQMRAQMFIRGTNTSIPLQFVRVQPYVSPKIALSNERTERVDVRVLPVIFRFERSKEIELFPGQLVDVYVAER